MTDTGTACSTNQPEIQPEAIPELPGFPKPGGLRGLDLRALALGTEVVLHTQTSRYRIVMVEPNGLLAVVQGGCHIPDEMEALVEGAVVAGGFVESGWIVLGRSLALWLDDRHVVTSRVRSIRINVPSRPA